MFERQQAAMACVRKFGRPDLIITETTNPRWPESFDSLTPGQQPHDRPDLLVRVFRLKIQNVLNFKSLVYRMHLFFFGCHMMPNSISGTIFFYVRTLSENPSFISTTFFSNIFPSTAPKPEQSRSSQLVYNKSAHTGVEYKCVD